MIYVVAHAKGGVGKTTTAINLASTLKFFGRDVWMIDTDELRASQKAITLRGENENIPSIPCDYCADVQTLFSQVRAMSGRFDDVVIDCAGGDSKLMRSAMGVSDLVLTPFAPRDFDVWGFDGLVPLINDVRSTGKDLKVYAFLCIADPPAKRDEDGGILRDSNDNVEAIRRVVDDYPEVKYITPRLSRRKAFPKAASNGISVFELSGEDRDPSAITELTALIEALG